MAKKRLWKAVGAAILISVSTAPSFVCGRGWPNSRLGKKAPYAAAADDCGRTIALGGAAFYALTINVAPAYAASCVFVVVNEDAARGKTIAVDGLKKFILWPGQSITVYHDGDVWRIIPAGQRWRLPGNVSFYVDNSLGSDSNDCLASGAGACLTVQHAMESIRDNIDYNGKDATIQLAAGQDNSGGLGLKGGVGDGGLIIDGAMTATISNASSDAINTAGNVLQGVTVQNVKLSSAGGFCLLVQNIATVRVGTGVNFQACRDGHIAAQDAGTIVQLFGDYTISGNAPTHFNAANGGQIIQGDAITVTLTGTPEFSIAFALAFANGTYYAASRFVTFSGAARGSRYNAQLNGVIYTGGAGADYFPGDSAGATATGGQYN